MMQIRTISAATGQPQVLRVCLPTKFANLHTKFATQFNTTELCKVCKQTVRIRKQRAPGKTCKTMFASAHTCTTDFADVAKTTHNYN